jgi:hypothetical protein
MGCNASFAACIRERQPEIEEAVLMRTLAASGRSYEPRSSDASDLRQAVAASVTLALAAIEQGDDVSLPIPSVLLTHAQAAARAGLNLADLLRACFAGYLLLCQFIVEEAEGGRVIAPAALTEILGVQAALFDRVAGAVTEEFQLERERPRSTDQRRAKLVRRLLAGEPVDATELGYQLDAHHVGVVAGGDDARRAVDSLARALDCRVLAVRQDDSTIWGWLGSRRCTDPSRIVRSARSVEPPSVPLAVGEPCHGIGGWRRTHRQARAAFLVAQRRPQGTVRYADVALLASALQDDLLASSLHDLYLAPLQGDRNSGETLRATLRAYFATGRNGASAAAALNVSRQTVTNRLQTAEDRLGRPIAACATALETALRLEELGVASPLDKGRYRWYPYTDGIHGHSSKSRGAQGSDSRGAARRG